MRRVRVSRHGAIFALGDSSAPAHPMYLNKLTYVRVLTSHRLGRSVIRTSQREESMVRRTFTIAGIGVVALVVALVVPGDLLGGTLKSAAMFFAIFMATVGVAKASRVDRLHSRKTNSSVVKTVGFDTPGI